MKVQYDKKVDAAHIRFSSKCPVRGVEIKEGVILHVTSKGEIVALEILDASKRIPVRNLITLEVERGRTKPLTVGTRRGRSVLPREHSPPGTHRIRLC